MRRTSCRWLCQQKQGRHRLWMWAAHHWSMHQGGKHQVCKAGTVAAGQVGPGGKMVMNLVIVRPQLETGTGG